MTCARPVLALQADSKPVSIFVFDKEKHASLLNVAENALKRIKTLRHPNMVTYIDSVDLEVCRSL